jgi:5-hydroxyisourate hydrolase-like protein (transthyretin family)
LIDRRPRRILLGAITGNRRRKLGDVGPVPAYSVDGRRHQRTETEEFPTVITAPPKLQTLLASLVMAGALALGTGVARADQYVVDHCKHPDDTPGVAFADFSGATTNDCGAGGGLHRQIASGGMAANSSVAMTLSIPADRPNITIARVLTVYGAPAATTFTPAGGTPFLALYNQFGQEMRNNIPPATPTVDSGLPAGDRALTWSLYCANDAAGNNCTYASDFVLHVYRTRLWLDEGVAPALTVDGGTLVAAGAHSGTQSLAYDAADVDSGVASVSVSLDTTVVGAVQYPCAHDDWSACARDRPSQLLQVDTTKVPDGNHELIVTVRDAANNALTRSLGTVAVANGPGAGTPNGANPSRLAKISARFATTTARTRRLRYSAQATVRGTLVDERGRPITGATIAILQRRRSAGARQTQIATVTTGADGRFSTKLRSGPSRTITFAYSAFSGDAKPATTSTLRTTVRALVSIRMSPRSVPAGGRVTMTGRILLAPRAGVEIRVQARNGRRWQTIDNVRTNARGGFHYRYRFGTAGSGKTFAFRALVTSAIYPFAKGYSKPRFVHVR